ncbi:MAG: class I SAM-dependent RNA methyltransferase [Clostridia bacterium]|nr:class I SAM-dependent RNA methyltransferase [Clostridia bacterium]
MEKTDMIATCLFGLEKHLGEEIDALGCERVYTMDGRVRFSGGAADIARANIFLRTAERVCLLAGEEFEAGSFDALFEGTRAIPWERFIPRDGVFPVSGHSVRSALTSIPDCQKIVKKAIAVRLGEAYGLSVLPEEGAKYPVEFFIFKDRCALMIDTSGVALHKRGYRPAANAAPLRETLAAALCLTARAGLREDVLLWDPFCGSGTIAIEAAMIAAGIAPGAGRAFAGESQIFCPKEYWEDARLEAEDKRRETSFRAVGTDIDPACISTARANADRAGVGKYINFYRSDVRKIERPEGVRGTFICNPPYGERMMSLRDAERLYRDLRTAFAPFDGWQIYVLTSCEYFERLFGRTADKKRKLYNGTIPCTFYQFFRPRDARV